MRLHGTCHCGNLQLWLTWEPDPVTIAARACTCSFCTLHGAAWTSWPAGRLDVAVRDPALVSKYVFGTRTADLHVCARCGGVPLATCDVDGRTYAVINVNALRDIATGLITRTAVDLGDEATDQRLARRKRNWIGDVRFVSAP
jgi:hypothetical protein